MEHIIRMTCKYNMVINNFLMVISADFDFLVLFTYLCVWQVLYMIVGSDDEGNRVASLTS